MPIKTKKQTQIYNEILDDMVAQAGDASIRLVQHPLNVLARTISASLEDIYGQLQQSVNNAFVTTAIGSDLDRLGRVWNVARGQATKATGIAKFTGAIDAIIPTNTRVSIASGEEFLVTEQAVIRVDGTTDINFIAANGGVSSNVPAKIPLALVNPLTGIAPNGTIIGDGFTGGTALENDSNYRARILIEIRNPLQAGTETDYIFWGLDRQSHNVSVTRVWPAGPSIIDDVGKITIIFAVDGGQGDFLTPPSELQILAVKNYIDTVRPMGAFITINPLVSEDVSITISKLSLIDNYEMATVEATIKADLASLFLRHAIPDIAMPLSAIYETIAFSEGVNSFDLIAPENNINTTENGAILKLGEVTFTA